MDPLVPMADISATEGYPTATDPSRPPSPESLSKIAAKIARFLQLQPSKSERDTIVNIYGIIWSFYDDNPPAPEAFVSGDVFNMNLTTDTSSLFDLVKNAAREEDWKDVVSHGMHLALSWTGL
jgi:hypothetical protein